jgi:hypothetical protein
MNSADIARVFILQPRYENTVAGWQFLSNA